MNHWTVWLAVAIVVIYDTAVVIAFRRRFPKSRKKKYCRGWELQEDREAIIDENDYYVNYSPEQLKGEK